MFKLILLIALLSSFNLQAASTVELRELLSQGLVKTKYESSFHPKQVEVIAKNYFPYRLNSLQVLNALREILELPKEYILNGNGTSVLIPIKNEEILRTDSTHYSFCYETLNSLSSFSNPFLQVKNEDHYYVYCDITPLIIKNRYKTSQITNVAVFNFNQLFFAWREIANKGESEIFHYNSHSDSSLYKKPSFFFNNKQYPIRAPSDYEENDNISAQGYCELKKEQDFVEKYGKDSVISVKNQEVIELNEYGNPTSIDFHKEVLVWNAIVCSPED
ncbi:MAG: hypothetical protein MK008_06385 [Bdellovibrionales bacterium]|nr:hypothetical protein [Bdellovibrionales bacterium]